MEGFLEVSRTINIAIISYFFDMGGVQKSSLSIAEHLSKQCFTFHMINLTNDFFQDRFRECGSCNFIQEPSRVIKYLRDHNIQIVHTNNCDAGSYLAHLAEVPRIIERLDGLGSAFIFDKSPVDCIVASTDAVYRKALNDYPKKYVKLIYNGINTSLFSPLKRNSRLRKELNIQPDEVVIGYLARISREKRQHKVIEVFKELLKTENRIKLILIGNDHADGYREFVNEKILELGLDNHVFLLEGTEHPANILDAFDIGINCSGTYVKADGNIQVHQEGYSNSIMEQMCMEKPMVATNSGETSSIVKDGTTGFVTGIDDMKEFYDKLLILIKNKDLRKSLGKNGCDYIKNNFDLSKMIDNYETSYRYLLTKEFSDKYKKTRDGTEKYFFKNCFKPTKKNFEKKILVIRSGRKKNTDNIVHYLQKEFVSPEISFLCNKINYEDVIKYEETGEIFVYDKSDKFNLDEMRDVVDKINKKNFDYLFFIFNEFNGLKFHNKDDYYTSLKLFKESKNIIDLCNTIVSDKKIAVTFSGKMYEW